MNDENRFLLDSVVMQITIAMERELLTSERETARAEAERERFQRLLTGFQSTLPTIKFGFLFQMRCCSFPWMGSS